MRASALACACAWAGGRVSAALAPIVLLPILEANGPHAMLAVIIAALVLNWILVLGGRRGLSEQAVARFGRAGIHLPLVSLR